MATTFGDRRRHAPEGEEGADEDRTVGIRERREGGRHSRSLSIGHDAALGTGAVRPSTFTGIVRGRSRGTVQVGGYVARRKGRDVGVWCWFLCFRKRSSTASAREARLETGAWTFMQRGPRRRVGWSSGLVNLEPGGGTYCNTWRVVISRKQIGSEASEAGRSSVGHLGCAQRLPWLQVAAVADWWLPLTLTFHISRDA